MDLVLKVILVSMMENIFIVGMCLKILNKTDIVGFKTQKNWINFFISIVLPAIFCNVMIFSGIDKGLISIIGIFLYIGIIRYLTLQATGKQGEDGAQESAKDANWKVLVAVVGVFAFFIAIEYVTYYLITMFTHQQIDYEHLGLGTVLLLSIPERVINFAILLPLYMGRLGKFKKVFKIAPINVILKNRRLTILTLVVLSVNIICMLLIGYKAIFKLAYASLSLSDQLLILIVVMVLFFTSLLGIIGTTYYVSLRYEAFCQMVAPPEDTP